MLARLEAIDGVIRAQVDRGGHRLRLSVRDPGALESSVALLDALGHHATEGPTDRSNEWYDARSVGVLSRLEAGTIADRIVPALALRRGLPDEQTAPLHAVIVGALHRCFLENRLGEDGGAFRQACVTAVEVGARSIIGAEGARELARSLDADLGGAVR